MTDWVEKPPHVDHQRMVDISTDDLVAVMAGGADPLRAFWERHAGDDAPTPWRSLSRWARDVRGLRVVDETLEAAQTLVREPIPDFVGPAAGRSGLYGLHYLTWTHPLLQGYALTGDEVLLARWGDIFQAWYSSRTKVRGAWPGLDVIWYSLGTAIRNDVLLDAVGCLAQRPAQVDRIGTPVLKALLGHQRWLAEEHDEFRPGNWQIVAAAGLVHTGHVLDAFDESAAWTRRGLDRLLDHLELGFTADGGHVERSPGYHVLALSSLHKAAISIERGGDGTLIEHDRLHAAGRWLAQLAMPDGLVPAFNDSPVVDPVESLAVAHHLSPDADIRSLLRRVSSPERIRTALAGLAARAGEESPWQSWLRCTDEPPPSAGSGRFQASTLLPNSKFAVLRGSGSVPDRYAAINLGPQIPHELESHSHRTCLDVVAVANGVPVLWEAGGPTSYDDDLYQTWYRSAHSHSVLTIDQRDTADTTDADVDVFFTSEVIDIVRASAGPHSRTVLSVKATGPAWWVIRDVASAGSLYQWNAHGRSPWITEGDGWRTAEAPGCRLRCPQVSAHRLTDGPTRWPDVAIAGGRPGTQHGIVLENETGRFDVLVAPFADEAAAAAPSPVVSPTSDGLRISAGVWLDEIAGDTWWRSEHGRLRTAASWTGPLRRNGGPLVDGAHVTAATWTAATGGVTATVRTSKRCTVSIDAATDDRGRIDEIRLNGVRLVPEPTGRGSSGRTVRVALPSAGPWTVTIGSGRPTSERMGRP